MTYSQARAAVSTACLRYWHLPALYLLFLVVGMAVRAPYRDAFFWADDFKFFREIGLFETGRLSFFTYLFEPEFGKHSLPLSKLVFFGNWYFFGFETTHWRLITELTQALSAVLLFRLMRFYGVGQVGALFGALTWAAAAIGGVDGPLAWLSCYLYPLALTCLLAAMVAITRATEYPRLTPWLVFLFSIATLLAAVVTFPVLAAVPLQLLTLRRLPDRSIPRGIVRRVSIGFIGAAILFGMPLVLALGVANRAGGQVLTLSPRQLVERTSAQFVSALQTLVYDYPPILPLVIDDAPANPNSCRHWYRQLAGRDAYTAATLFPHRFARLDARTAAEPTASLQFSAFVIPGLFAVLLLVSAAVSASSSQRILLGVFFVPIVGQLLLINVGSQEAGLTKAVAFTHYSFFATICWCVCFAVIIDTLTRQLRRIAPSWLALIGLFPLGLILIHQRDVAEDGRQMFDAAASTDIILHHWLQQALERIRQDQRESQSILRLPDLHVGLTNLTEEQFPLSAYLALTCREGIPNVVVVPGSKLTRAEWRSASRALSQGNDLAAKFWADNVSSQYEITQLVQWLMPIALAQDKPLAVPDIVLSSSFNVNLSSFVKLSHGTSTDLLEFVPCELVSDEQLQSLLRVLQGPPDPARQWWIDQIEKLRRGRPSDMDSRPKSAD